MSFRSKVSAIAITAAACIVLAPAATASSGPVQVTGKQLKSALLPPSDFLAGYKVANENDSGRKLEHGTLFKLPSMSAIQAMRSDIRQVLRILKEHGRLKL